MIVAGSKPPGGRRAHKPAYKRRGRRLFLCFRSGTLLQVLLESGLPFDQAIVYRRKRFLHLSYRQGRCRKMVLYK